MDGKVALVTGAGHSVGRGIALEMAQAVAAAVVNDFSVVLSDDGSPAELVAAEIIAAGGGAIANHDRVADWDGGCAMVKAVIDSFGHIVAVVGNLCDLLFHKMGPDDFDAVLTVHLKGSSNTSRATAPFSKEQESGAFVHMTSTIGLKGNFCQPK